MGELSSAGKAVIEAEIAARKLADLGPELNIADVLVIGVLNEPLLSV